MPASAAEPLIGPARDEHPSDDRPSVSAEGDDESQLVTPGRFVWVLSVCAGVSGLLFGYDTGVISSTLVSVGSDLSRRPLTTLDKSLITSCTSFFALLASPCSGVLADHLGRKTVILAASVLFVAGALIQAASSSVAAMIAGRSVVGAAVGSASFVVPLYISELAPSPFRGRLVVVASLFITGGQVVAYVVGWLFSSAPAGWRWMVGLGAVPAAVQFVMLWAMPETPRWLVRAGKKEQARRVLVKVYEGSEGVSVRRLADGVLRRVEREILEEEDALGEREGTKEGWSAQLDKVHGTFVQLVTVGGNRRALTIACMLQGVQQLCGFNSLMYFSATIFSLVGFKSPTLASLSIAITNFLLTLVAFHAIDRIGRRRILLCSIPIMVGGLVLCAIAFRFVQLPLDSQHPSDGGAWPLVILAAMVTYVAGYAVGLGNVPWQQSELFPLPVRSLGSALATATNWASNTLVGLTFLPMMQFLTPTGTFALYAIVCTAALASIWAIYPETAGLSLEDVGSLLRDGWGVQESLRRAHARRRVDRS